MSERKSYPSDLSDERWALIEPVITAWKAAHPSVSGHQGGHAMREIVNAILCQGRTGCQWDYLPHDLPPRSAVYHYFARWRDDGTGQAIHDLLRWQAREKRGRLADPSLVVPDTQSVHAGAGVPASTTGRDAGKRVPGRKRGLAVDVLGLVMAVVALAAPAHENAAGIALLDRVAAQAISSESAFDCRQQRPGLDHRLVPGPGDRGAQVPGAVGRIGVPGELIAGRISIVTVIAACTAGAGGVAARGGLSRHELRRDRRVGVPRPGGPGQLLIGDDPGPGAGSHVGAVPVPAGLGGLAGVPGIRVDGGDDAVFGNLTGDPPPPAGPVAALGRLDVLPGDQRQQRHRRRGRLGQLLALQRGQQRVRVVHQRRHQGVLGGRVIPVDLRLAGVT